LMSFHPFKIYAFLATFIVFFAAVNIHAADNGISYKVSFTGLKDETLLSDIQSISDAVGNADHQMASEYLLQKMAERDKQNFIQLLRARGFYDASVQYNIKLVKKTHELTFLFELEDAYILKSVKIELSTQSESGGLILPDSEYLGLAINKSFSSKKVLDAQDNLISFAKRNGFPLAKISGRDVEVDHKDRSASVFFRLDTGPKAVFGNTTFTGLVSLEEDYLAGKLPWKKGDPYNGDLIESARTAISTLGLFTLTQITPGTELGEGSTLPIRIDVAERKHKSISVGLNYITNEGPGVKFSWENRNLFDRGELLRTNYELSNHIVTAEGTFKKLDFLKKNQTLRLSVKVGRENTDAYTSTSIVGSGFFDRDLTKKVHAGLGFSLKSASVEQLAQKERFHYLSFPLYFNIDTTNDLLDPVRGQRFSLQITPYYEVMGPPISFVKTVASYKLYETILKNPFTVFATNFRIGIINGTGRQDIAADERFYAGGGGSIRGYFYQRVGPLTNATPIGGKALMEISTELRLKISTDFGIAAFLDGGTAFSDNFFPSGERLHWGTGLGIRYYTPVGPLRLDVGFPIKKRLGIDKSYQIYLSLGQAF
jgi:translocation and assembly module TamA